MPKVLTPNTVIICTGGFDPIHSGHVSYLQHAKIVANTLVVGVNSDEWLIRKKGKNFMPISERVAVVSAISGVDQVITFDDSDNTAINCIQQVMNMYPTDNIIFANGGDRTLKETPEVSFCMNSNVAVITDVGNTKTVSSSQLLADWDAYKLTILL